MRKISTLIAATAVIALLGAGCSPKQTNTNVPSAAGASRANIAAGKMTVKILPNGEFDPITAFVKKGTTVTFMNSSEKAHKIVPQDDAKERYDGLNSKSDIIPGGKFSVTMDKTGRWLYSDGNNPAFGGAIEVTE